MSIFFQDAPSLLVERLAVALDHVVLQLLDIFGNKYRKTNAEIESWGNKLINLRGVLRDAHKEKSSNSEIGRWLEDMEELVYDVEDLLDHYNYKVKQRRQKEESRKRKFFRLLDDHRVSIKLSSALKSITCKFDDLMERKEFLGRLSIARSCSTTNSRTEGPVPPETETIVYDTEGEKRAIIEYMLKPEQGVGVYPIVGMGGIGKTALARYAFNYHYRKEFTIKAWIFVSIDYDRVRIYKAIIEFVTGISCSLEDPAAIQRKVEELLRGKRFLIVIDDLWEINVGEWAALKSPLLNGAADSKVIVTTRNFGVAYIVRTQSCIPLSGLSETDSWHLFCSCAGVPHNEQFDSNLAAIGRKIVAKLGRLPLAIRLIGSLLRRTLGKKDWEAIANKTSLSYRDEMANIMWVMKMSFDHLPYHSKKCFLFCAMFPKDYEYEQDEIVNLWVAAGLIESDQQSRSLIEQGRRNFHELVSRSLLLRSGNGFGNNKYQMHDLIREMGNGISGNKFCCWENKIGSIVRTRNLFFKRSIFCEIVKSVRTVQDKALPLRMMMAQVDNDEFPIDEDDMDILFTKLRNVRVFSLPGCSLSRLSNSIGKMKLLTYLDLSFWRRLTILPPEIGKLISLFTLRLFGCKELTTLPPEMGMLANLSILDLRECEGLTSLPSQIGLLNNLSLLDLSYCYGLTVLPSEIGMLTNLSLLNLGYCYGLTTLPSEIGNLSNLSQLYIRGCQGLIELPYEIGMLTKLSFLDTCYCHRLNMSPSEIEKLINLPFTQY